ncbi:hypothetical protein ACIRNI_24895 [Streptomyces sp. NPDC093546]|uniref:hypothetical protein n=1 Tax=Streptomyces sp. NPDC093546 TaxID=3366040 RepID=UPI0038306FDE
MQRTRTTARILATVAMAAVSGCVAVEPHPGSAPAVPEASHPASRGAAPQIVEGPAREALEAALPTPPAAPAPPPSTAQDRRKPAGAGAVPGGGPHRDDRPPRRAPRAPSVPDADDLRARLPKVRPPARPSVPVTVPDVCALGEDYGGWQRSSQEARACREAYGH